jgi:tRNA G18 (ribose-2'-O)-methylase SpoU
MNRQAQAKKLAGHLRNYMLRLGKKWEQAPVLYDRQVAEQGWGDEFLLAGSTQHRRVLDLYIHFRHEAGLEKERDIYFESEDGDREMPLAAPIPYAVLAHNLRSAYNVGSLFRSCDCFGWEAVHTSGYTPCPEHPALKSAGRGAETWVPHTRWEDPLDCVWAHKQKGYAVMALETGGTEIARVEWPEKCLFLVGNEELGLAPELLDACEIKVGIPMRGRKASLNVASAFAVLGYAAMASTSNSAPSCRRR